LRALCAHKYPFSGGYGWGNYRVFDLEHNARIKAFIKHDTVYPCSSPVLFAGDFCRIRAFALTPDPVEFLQIQFGQIRVVDDEQVIIVFLIC